jgi:hypothetical protein
MAAGWVASDVSTDRMPGQVDKDNCACLPKDKGTTVLSKRQHDSVYIRMELIF